MRVSDFASEADGHCNGPDEGLSPAEARRLREVSEMVGMLRQFAEHFGAAEVYRQARALYHESDEGRAALAREEAEMREGKRQGIGRLEPGRQPKATSTTRGPRHRSLTLEEAKRALGG